MAFKLVKGPSDTIHYYCGTSSAVTEGSLVVADRSGGIVIKGTAALLTEDTVGVATKTPATADTTVTVIPCRGRAQVWEWDTTNNTATNQLCKRHLLTDSLNVNNTSSDVALDETVVEAVENVGAAADKKQRGHILVVGGAVS